MALLNANPGRLIIKFDTGEMKGTSAVYRNISIGGVKGVAEAGGLAALANAVAPLVAMQPESVTVNRTFVLAGAF